MSHYADLSGGARARSRVQGCRSSRNHSISLDLVGELSGFPLVPCPDCGMARVVEGRTRKQGENHGCLYFKCARNSVSSLLCLPNPGYGSYVLLIL
jgi:ssDNA-binding Zn-finger/Zn-ribbon topoisomerase 1